MPKLPKSDFKSLKFDAVVGSPAQVSAGLATHSDLQVAHDSLSNGQSMLILANTFTPAQVISFNIVQKLRPQTGSSVLFNNQGERRGDIFTTPTFPTAMTHLQLNVGRNSGTITGTPGIVVDLWNTSGGLPIGGIGGFIASTNAVLFSALPNPLNYSTFTNFNLPSPFVLTPSTTYAFSTKQNVFDTGGAQMTFFTARPIQTQGYLFDDVEGAGFFATTFDEWAAFRIVGTATGVNISKRLRIEGSGYASQIEGILNFQAGSERSIVRGLRFNRKLTFNANQIQLADCWMAPSQVIEDNGIDNNIRIVTEA